MHVTWRSWRQISRWRSSHIRRAIAHLRMVLVLLLLLLGGSCSIMCMVLGIHGHNITFVISSHRVLRRRCNGMRVVL